MYGILQRVLLLPDCAAHERPLSHYPAREQGRKVPLQPQIVFGLVPFGCMHGSTRLATTAPAPESN